MRGLLAFLLLALLPTAARADDDHYQDGSKKDAEMGIALLAVQRGVEPGRPGQGYGFRVSQHAHFGRKFGTEVGFGVVSGQDRRGYYRTDLEFLMPAFVFRVPTKGKVQPFASAGFVMTTSFFTGEELPKMYPFVYAGMQSAAGLEVRTSKDLSWIFQVATTLRGRFTVEKDDRPFMSAHPGFDTWTRTVHETTFSAGVALF
ncbi:MAG: hypothetical protein HYV09_34065 [Deltaproteobacteria bacterium]|nr:hypothetical protein [Deltaproteobacteria bacterium]